MPFGVRAALLVLGVAGIVLGPLAVAHLARTRTAALDRAAPDRRASVTPLMVSTPEGSRLGWLSIDYPRKLRLNQDGSVNVVYRAQPKTWRSDAQGRLALTVTLLASHLTLQPEPHVYRFDTSRIGRTGEDNHIWTISPQEEGDYTLVVQLAATPPSFQVGEMQVNHNPKSMNAAAVTLPVRVDTRYYVPQAVVDLGKAVAAGLSFLLTLPAFKLLVERYFKSPPDPAG